MTVLIDMIRYHWRTVSAFLLAAITVLSLWPLEMLPDVPGNDKIHHYLAYNALMVPVALRRPKHWPVIALFFLAWSGAIELLQPYVNRYGEWLDFSANCAGLLSGLALGLLVNQLFPERRCLLQ